MGDNAAHGSEHHHDHSWHLADGTGLHAPPGGLAVADGGSRSPRRSGKPSRHYLAAVTADELTRSVDVLENGPHLARDCITTVFEEEFWHHRHAERDLAKLETSR